MHEAGWSATDIKIGCHEQNTFFYTGGHSGKYDIFKELKSFKGEHFSGGSFFVRFADEDDDDLLNTRKTAEIF